MSKEYYLASSHITTETGQEFRVGATFPSGGPKCVTGDYIHVIEKSAYDNLAAKNAELKKELARITCGYCGQMFEREWSELQEHILACEKHPVFQAKSQNAALVEIVKKAIINLEDCLGTLAEAAPAVTMVAANKFIDETKSKLDALGIGDV